MRRSISFFLLMKAINWEFLKQLPNQIRTFFFLFLFSWHIYQERDSPELWFATWGYRFPSPSYPWKSNIAHSGARYIIQINFQAAFCPMEGKVLRSRRGLKPSIIYAHSLLFNYFLFTSGSDYYCINSNGSFGYQDLLIWSVIEWNLIKVLTSLAQLWYRLAFAFISPCLPIWLKVAPMTGEWHKKNKQKQHTLYGLSQPLLFNGCV